MNFSYFKSLNKNWLLKGLWQHFFNFQVKLAVAVAAAVEVEVAALFQLRESNIKIKKSILCEWRN